MNQQDTASLPVDSTTRAITTASTTSTTSTTYLVRGYIDSVASNGFHLNGGSGVGYIWVYTNSGTKTAYGSLTPGAGKYAVVVGAGSLSSSLTATYAALYTGSVSMQTISGQLTSTQPYGYALRVPNGAYVPLAVSSSTSKSGSLALWNSVSVSAIGSTTTGYAALSIAGPGGTTVQSSSTPAPSTGTATAATTTATIGVPKHLQTAEYLEGMYGTFAVSPSQAAPYLSWAQTSLADSNAIHNAGIKTQIYIDPNWLATTDPMYPGSIETNFSHICSGSRVTIKFGSAAVRYDTNPNSLTNHAHFATWVSTAKAQGHVDMIWEDNPGPLSPYASYPNGMPCGYSTSTWVSGAISLNNAISVPVMVNGLNAFTTSEAPNTQVVLQGSNTAGGDLEGCYNDLNKPVETGSSWFIMENEELAVVRAGKLFECMGRDQGAAYANVTGRIFSLASFLLSYDPAHAIFASEWATPSKFRVMPESGLVPLNPLVSTPSSISALKTSSGAYGREYANCYYRGVRVGACAIAVTHDYGAYYRFPFSGYTRTLKLSGNGVTDGGTAAFNGPPPPSTMAPYTAVIAFK